MEEELTPEQILAKEDEIRRWYRAEDLGQKLCDAVNDKDLDNAKRILFQALEWECGEMVANSVYYAPHKGASDMSPLVIACLNDDLEMVKLLLSFPDIIPQSENCKWDPVRHACHYSSSEVWSLLLRDRRIKADVRDSWGETPLRRSAWEVEVVRWLIASRKPIGSDDDMWGAEDAAKQQAKEHSDNPKIPLAVELIKSYRRDPVATTKRVRVELGLDVSDAAELYALMVLFCDGYLAPTATDSPTARFFAMVSRLPVELQMTVCHRAFDSPRDLVKRQDSEVAFKRLGEILALEDGWRAPSCVPFDYDTDPKYTFRGKYKIEKND